MHVRLCEISKENYQSVVSLKVTPEQQVFTVSNARALADTKFDLGRIPLGIVDGQRQAMVGFLVYGLDETTRCWWLYHLMVDAPQQHQGYGRIALEHLVAQLENNPTVKHLYARYHVTNEAARAVGARLGFQAMGNVGDEQIVVTLDMPGKTLPTPNITLRDVTLANARECIQLQVAPSQAQFVASNAASLVQSKFEAHWLTKAIYNDDVMVGFVMYGCDPEFGWGVLRLMIDAAYQGRGYGRAAMQLVLAHIWVEGGTSVGVSYEANNTVARRLYHSLGFVETGEEPFGEPFAVLTLAKDTHLPR